MNDKIVSLPTDFIGKEDEQRLESFGAYLISHGLATRWQWRRENGIDTGFEILQGTQGDELVCTIRRDARRDTWYVADPDGGTVDEGELEQLMAFVDERLKGPPPRAPA